MLQIVVDNHLLPKQSHDREGLDDLIRVPDHKLRVFGVHLQEYLAFCPSRMEVVSLQIDIDTAIPADAAQNI